MRLQIGATTKRTEIIRITRAFRFLATAWLKNWMVIYWLGKLNTNILLKCVHLRGAKISWMTAHVKPTLRDINPDHVILHAGTNDLRTKNTASQIAKATIDLATSLKDDDNTVTVSGIVPRLDDLNNKANEMNRRLVLMCKERNISFLSHDESNDLSKHLNESKLHLNNNGIKIFAENLSRFLVKLNWRQQRKTNFNTSVSLDFDKKFIAVKLRANDQPNLPKLVIQRKPLKIWDLRM